MTISEEQLKCYVEFQPEYPNTSTSTMKKYMLQLVSEIRRLRDELTIAKHSWTNIDEHFAELAKDLEYRKAYDECTREDMLRLIALGRYCEENHAT